MKRIAALITLLAVLSIGFLQAQEKATLSSYRVMPKPGKDAALKKAITDHAAKYHTGNWKWRVFSVLSGPDEGAYQINEGPNSWTTLEGRKDISDEHTKDYETNVLPLVERTTPTLYVRFQKEVSSADSAVGPLKKALLRHIFPKPGKGARIMSDMSTWKKVWEKMGLKVVVWSSFYSGEPQIIISTRLPQGWVDLEQIKSKDMIEAFDGFAGRGAYDRFLEDNDKYVSKTLDEMIEFLPEASSK
jgi:hypothetical protein